MDKILAITFTGYGSKVQIYSYNSNNNRFTVPATGIVFCRCHYSSGSYAQAIVYDKDNNELFGIGQSTPSNANNRGNDSAVAIVFQGQKIQTAWSGPSNTIEYWPFVGGGTN